MTSGTVKETVHYCLRTAEMDTLFHAFRLKCPFIIGTSAQFKLTQI
jgi:hypothetical protein